MVYGELGRFPLEIYVTTSDYPLLVLITNRKTRKDSCNVLQFFTPEQ
jgi:hypothetical protein